MPDKKARMIATEPRPTMTSPLLRFDPKREQSERVRIRGVLSALARSNSSMLPVIASLLVIGVFFELESSYFLSPTNLSNLAVQVTIVGAVALGEVLVLLLGEIDLSLGSISGVAAAILGVMITNNGVPWWSAIIVMIVAGAVMGAFQGVWIGVLRVPSFVVTLAGLLAFLGMQLEILGPNGTLTLSEPHLLALTADNVSKPAGWLVAFVAVAVYSAAVLRRRRKRRTLGLRSGRVGADVAKACGVVLILALVVGSLNAARGIPVAFAVLVALIALVWWVTRRTIGGKYLFAVGGDAEAARRAGIRLRAIRTATFTAAGVLGAVAGLLAASYNHSAGTLTGGGTLLLEAIGAAVIGGCSLFGGRGTAWAALFGALVLAGVGNGLDLTNHSAPTKYIVEGTIVLLAVSFDTLMRRRNGVGRERNV